MGEQQERDPEPDGPSLEDEIFAVASSVEEAPPSEPLLRLRRPPLEPPPRRDLGIGAAGFLTFLFVDAVMMWAPLMMSRRPSLLPQMVTLIVLAFGLGGLLVWKVRGSWRPFGFGLMLGWVFLTLVSVGFLTGLPLY